MLIACIIKWLCMHKILLSSAILCTLAHNLLGVLNGKPETWRDAETLPKNLRLYCKKVKKSETKGNSQKRDLETYQKINVVPRFLD